MKSIHFIIPFVQNAGGQTLEISLNTIIPFNYILMLMDNGILLIVAFQVFHTTRRKDRGREALVMAAPAYL